MSTWTDLCEMYDANLNFLPVSKAEFDKLRAVVEAAKYVDKYCSNADWDEQQLTFGDNLAKALNALGVIE